MTTDGIAQITQALKGRRGLSSLHIVAHGEAGKLWLGNGFVDSSTLEQYSDDLQSWAAALAPDADILLYGCNVAAGETGRQFVQLFSQLTGADVAASSNLTGSAALGGDWELEVKIGNVEAPIAFGAETVEAYNAVLTTRRVSVGTDGTQGNGDSSSPSISADGRYVAFRSNASNLVSGDTNGNTGDIFVYDTVANTTRRVSVDDNGTQGNSFSYSPSISADGRYVAFDSDASNLVSGDTNNTSDIFVYDTVANTTRRVSVATTTAPRGIATPTPLHLCRWSLCGVWFLCQQPGEWRH
jgi:ribosomal protein L14